MADWHPVKVAIADLDIPASADFTIDPRSVAPTRINRRGLSDCADWKFRNVWGVVARISEADAENTSTPFRLEIAHRFNFRADTHAINTVSGIYATIQVYSSNLMSTDPCPIFPGGVVAGVATATYTGSDRPQLGAWRLTDIDEWGNLAPDTLFGDQFGNFEEWATDRALVLGGAAFAGDSLWGIGFAP